MTIDPATDVGRVRQSTRTRLGDTGRGPRLLGRAAQVAALALIASQVAAGLSNLGFHVMATRLLGPAGYGELGSLLAIMAVLAVPASTVETLVTARVAQRLERGEPLAATATIRRALAVGLTACALLLAGAPLLCDYLALGSVAPVVYLALYCVSLSAGVVPWGLLCGQRRFATAGGIVLAAAGARVGFGVLFIGWGGGVAGAIAASVCADAVRAVLLTLAARSRPALLGGADARPVRLGGAHAMCGIAAFSGMWLLTVVDVVLARHLFSPLAAGQYNVATTAARAVYFLSQGLCFVALPAFASADTARARGALRLTLWTTAGLGCVATAVFGLYGPGLLPVVFGSGIQISAGLLTLVVVAATGLALLWVVVQYQLARGAPAWAAWPGLLGAVAVASWFVAGPRTLAIVMIAASAVALAVGASAIRRSEARQLRPSMTEPGPLACVPSDAVDLTVVVPFYNPGDVLRANLLRLIAALRASGVSYEIVAVSDGCTDGSPATIADLDPTTVRRLDLPCNAGKGAALRLGLEMGRGRYLGFIDADGDLDPKLWEPFLTLMRLYEPDVILGAKCHPLSEVDHGPQGIRRLYSAGYRTLVRALFPTLRVRETQVGIKMFRRELLADVLPRTVERGFVFDLELLTVADRLGYRRMLPAPVRLHRSGPSTVSPVVAWRMFSSTVALAWRLWVVGSYDTAPRHRLRAGEAEQDTGEDATALPMRPLRLTEVW